MKRVYKYPLSYVDNPLLTLPIGAQFLHLDMQDGVPTLWALVDPEEQGQEERALRFAGTGHPISEEIIAHIGTTIDHEMGLVWHLFEVAR